MDRRKKKEKEKQEKYKHRARTSRLKETKYSVTVSADTLKGTMQRVKIVLEPKMTQGEATTPLSARGKYLGAGNKGGIVNIRSQWKHASS